MNQDNIYTPATSTDPTTGMTYVQEGELTLAQSPFVNPNQILGGTMQQTQLVGSQGGVQISGANNTISLTNGTSSTPNITLSGPKGYQLFTNPSTGINEIIIGQLPDGSYGMVVAKSGIDVLSLFS